ncbi:DUF6950 family protein [Albibacillus kandeliae]|uniref:DUF6950 family protein n=1 Tax=Albibacillus kandeliae TaxID=2174228 RepID=UPI000D693000|nr:hypothetical protein [Albibacillus kandeliae]
MKRLPDWKPRLMSYLVRAARRPFKEGEHDCALFLAGGVEAMTGEDYAAPYRGRYSTTLGGLRILKKDGFEDHVALAAHHLKEKPVAFAGVGDGAAVPTSDGPALGIVQGEGIYLLTPARIAIYPLLRAHKVFEV